MFIRHDLMALTSDDLATISNRGTLKRATKEISGDRVQVEIEAIDDRGGMRFVWRDEATVTIGADVVVRDAECDCPATSVCRHIIRSVLAYQRHVGADQASSTHTSGEHPEDASAHTTTGPWDPGASCDDEAIAQNFSAVTLRKARKLYEAGLVVELVRSSKPLARFHVLGHTLRFQVLGDLRYTRCDCAEEAPCLHVPLAIWAYRELEQEREGGFIETRLEKVEAPTELLDGVEREFGKIAVHGFTGTPRAALTRLEQLEGQLTKRAYIWPATILADLRQQYDHYAEHDARFSPDYVADLIGEFVVRADALRQPTLPIPRLFVQGGAENTRSKLGRTRLVGLGCSVIQRARSVIVQAMLQDDATGAIVALGHEFADPGPDEPDPIAPPLHALASKMVVKDRDIVSLGRGQIVCKGAHLGADHRLDLGRHMASAYPQNYTWDQLAAPVFAEDFAEVRARFGAMPPASLRPRRVGEDFHVVPIQRVEGARFDVATQSVVATLIDARGQRAEMAHPYTNRSQQGTERLLAWCVTRAERALFVAGQMHVGARGLVIHPTGVVFDEDGVRTLIQPWVDAFDERAEGDTRLGNAHASRDPIDTFRADLRHQLGDLFLLGLSHIDPGTHAQWQRLLDTGRALGMDPLLGCVASICEILDPDRPVPSREHEALTQPILMASVVSRLVQELA